MKLGYYGLDDLQLFKLIQILYILQMGTKSVQCSLARCTGKTFQTSVWIILKIYLKYGQVQNLN